MTKKLYDISLSLHPGIPVWPGDPPASIIKTSSIEGGNGFNSSKITASFHWGTHVDAPYHFFENRWTIDQIPLEILIGPAKLIDIPEADKITTHHLKKFNLTQVDRLIVKTRNSSFWSESPLKFHQDYTAFTEDAARFLLEKGIRLVGIDYLSIDLYNDDELPVHHTLYKKNVVAIEGLDLREVTPGNYQLICLPINIRCGDGAFARVLLQSDK